MTLLAFCAALAITRSAAADDQLSPVWIAAVTLGVFASFEAIEPLPGGWQFAARTFTRWSARSSGGSCADSPPDSTR